MLPWTCMGYSMEFHGTLESPNEKNHWVPWDSMELGEHHFKWHKIPWNFPWNSMELWYCQMKYNLIPWNSMKYDNLNKKLFKFHGILWNFCSRSGDSMEFHGIWWWHQVPWNFQSSMEFHGTSLLTWKMSMEFHGTSGEFHGIPWNCEILILINFIIGEVYFTVCYMISCHCISDNPLIVEILRYFNSIATFWCPSFWLNGGIPF